MVSPEASSLPIDSNQPSTDTPAPDVPLSSDQIVRMQEKSAVEVFKSLEELEKAPPVEVAENREAPSQLHVTPETTDSIPEAKIRSRETAIAERDSLEPPEVTYDLPIRFNKRVKQVLDYYLKKGRQALEKGISRSGKYLPLLRSILKEEGLPQDLAYLVATESNYNPRARSSSGAVGLWQFMKNTARIYHLRQDQWIDERMDVVKSTHAAARHLKYLYKQFGTWELALAAYNAGGGRVRKEIKRAKAKKRPMDYWSLQVPRETKRYVADYMAVTIISKNLEKYGLAHIAKESPMRRKKIKISTDFSLKEIAKRVKMPFKELWNLNPFLIQSVPPLDQEEHEIYLPHDHELRFVISLYKQPNPSREWKMKLAQADKSARMTELLTRYGAPTYIRVKKGDSLWKMAREHNTTVARLRRWNKVNKKGLLQINQQLKIYLPTWKVFDALIESPSPKADKSNKKSLAASNKAKKSRTITVKPGDTLSAIARKYRVTVKQLMGWNKLKRARELKAYQKLIVSPPPV